MASLVQRFIDWIKSLFWKEEMELTLVGLQYSGKTTFVNVIAVCLCFYPISSCLFIHFIHSMHFFTLYLSFLFVVICKRSIAMDEKIKQEEIDTDSDVLRLVL